MPTAFVKGDLFGASGLGALAQGCNCAGAMGKGIAVEFRKRFPEMHAAGRSDRRRCTPRGDPTDVGAKYLKSRGGLAQATPKRGAATSTQLISPMISCASGLARDVN
jgi:hypothetical protein